MKDNLTWRSSFDSETIHVFVFEQDCHVFACMRVNVTTVDRVSEDGFH